MSKEPDFVKQIEQWTIKEPKTASIADLKVADTLVRNFVEITFGAQNN
jgi:hypothetical protein